MKKRSAKNTEAFMRLARARKKQADESEEKQIRRELEDLEFLIDPWPSDIRTSRGGQNATEGVPPIPPRPCLFIDTLRDPIAHVAAEAQQTDLGPEIVPADDFSAFIGPIDDTEIELREGLVRKIQRDSDARDARNWAADRARKAGRGYYVVMTRYVSSRSSDQEVYVDGLYNQSTVRLDPRHEKIDGSDADWGFYGTDMSWEQYKAEHPSRASNRAEVDDDEEWRALGDQAPDWFTGEADTRSVRVMNYFYTERESVMLAELANGQSVERSSVKPTDVLAKDPETGEPYEARADVKKSIKWAKIDGAQILEETDWPSPYIPIVKVVWEQVQPYDKERRYQGMVRPARDPAFGVSVMATTEVEVALLAPKTPIVAYAGQFEGFEAAWDQANLRNIGRLEINARTTATGQKILPHPAPLVRNTDIGIWDGLRQMFFNAVKSSTGVPDATLGNVDPSIRSGRGIRLLQEQARQGTSGGLQNLVKSVTYEAKIINSLLCPIYGRRPGRLMQMMTGKHESQAVLVDQPFVRDAKQRPQAFDPQQHAGQEPQIYRLTPDADFNVAIRVSKDYDTRRQEEASTLGELIQSDPQLLTWFGDLFFENQDGPGHKDMAERAKLMLAPPIQQKLAGGAQANIPPHVQAMVTQLQTENQQLKQAQATDQVKVQGSLHEAQLKAQSDQQIAQLEAQKEIHLHQIDNAAKIEVARIQAAKESANVAAEAAEERLATWLEQAHEVGVLAQEQGHEHEMAQRATEAAQQGQTADQDHQQKMVAQAAQQQPAPETT